MGELINERTGRRRVHKYEQLEKDFQEAQEHWGLHRDEISWHKMFNLIRLAVFNVCNKKLEGKLPLTEIEERSLDITCNIMNSIRNKREKGQNWKVGKVSSFVYLPCMALQNEWLQFNDHVELSDTIATDYQIEAGTMSEGVIQRESYATMDFIDKYELDCKRAEILEAIEIAKARIINTTPFTEAEVERVLLKLSQYGPQGIERLTNKGRTILALLRNEAPQTEKGQILLSFYEDPFDDVRKDK